MITLEEIAGRLKDSKDYDFTINRLDWKPQGIEPYKTPKLNIKESKAKGAETKLRNKLGKVLAFINSMKYIRIKDGCTLMPISVTNKENLAIWGNEMGVSRGIAYMIEIGLINIENDKYQFGAYYEKDNKSNRNSHSQYEDKAYNTPD
mgnify:CR=1 FL=1